MPASCAPSDLMAQASGFQGLAPGMRGLIKLSLYCRWAKGVTGPCDLPTLMREASCFQCLSEGERTIARLALLCSIMQNPPVTPVTPTVPNIVANLWETFEFDAAPNTMTGAQLLASDHEGTGAWFVVSQSAISATDVTAEKTNVATVNGQADSGTRGYQLRINLAPGGITYVPAVSWAANPVSMGFWIKTPTAMVDGTYTFFKASAGTLLRVSVQVALGVLLFTASGASSATSAVPLQLDTWYWVTFLIQQNATCKMKIFDASNNVVDELIVTGNNQAFAQFTFGNIQVWPFNGGDKFFLFDNIVVDWTNAVYPILQ